jgi:YVTN family beta-propeller protein
MSVVYLAQDLRLDRKVALKLLAPELAEDERFRERFLRESRLAASLDHPNVIPIYEAGESGGLLYIAMRFVEGTDLKRLIEQEGRLEPASALAILAQVANALDEAHAHGLVHRDVKPGNVLLAAREHVYLSDFGLTTQTGSESGLTETGQFMGTADYVSPEQVERKPATAASDLYSLACMLYECLAGEAPYRSESLMGVLYSHVNAPPPSLHEHRPELPEAIDPVIAKGMAKKPGERYQRCSQLIAAARAALGVSGELAAQPATRARRRRRLVAFAALALAVIAAAVAIPLALTAGGRKPGHRQPTLVITADSIQHIDPATNTLVSTTRIGSGSTASLAAGEIGQVAVGEGAVWATNGQSGTLYRISPDTGEVNGRVQTSGDDTYGYPVDVVAGFGRVWVVNNGGGTVAEIDPKSLGFPVLPVPVTSGVPFEGGPMTIGTSLWVVADDCDPVVTTVGCPGEGELWFSDGSGNGTTSFPPLYVTDAAAADGVLWLSGYLDAGSGSGQLERIDEASHRYLDSTPLDFLPSGGLAAGDGAVWITDPVGDRLVRIDAATREVVTRIPVGRNPTAVALGTGSVWVTNYDDGTVSRIDPATNEVVARIEVGPHPDHVAADGSGVWVAVHP